MKRRELRRVKNLDIRMIVAENGLRYKDIAKVIGISPEWLSKLMRETLTIENRLRILGAIERLKQAKEADREDR